MDRKSLSYKEYREYIYQKYGQGINRKLWDSTKLMDPPVFNQESWRVQFATGETDAFKEDLNTNHKISVIVGGATPVVALRFLIQETVGISANNKTFQLEARVDGGTPFDVTDISADALASGLSLLGTDTTQRIGAGTFISPNAGVDEDDGIAGGLALDFAGNDECELLYSVQFPNSETDGTELFEFRLKGVDTFTAPEWLGILVNLVIDIPVASLVLTGFVPTPVEGGDKTIIVPVASLALDGFAVTLDESIPIPLATLTLTGFVPAALESTLVDIPVASLVLTGFAPTLKETIPVPLASLVLTGFVPVVDESTIVNIPVGSLVLTGLIPAALENTIIDIPVGSLNLAGFAPTVDEGTIIDIPVASLVLTGFVPLALENTIVNIPVATLNLTGFVPTPVEGADVTIVVPAGSLALTGFVPSAVENTTVEVPIDSKTIIDSYDISNQNSRFGLNNTVKKRGQSITGDGNELKSVLFHLHKIGSPTGSAKVELFAHSGTFGSSSVGTGSALATSDTIDVSTLIQDTDTNVFDPIRFNFSTPFTLVDGTNYVITVTYTNGSSTNQVGVAIDTTSPTHAGNASSFTTIWSSAGTIDLLFEANQSNTGLSLEGFIPTVLESIAVNVPVGSLILTGFVPTPVETGDTTINVPVGSLALAGSTVTLDESIPIPLATLALTAFVPSAVVSTIVNVPVGALNLTGLVPSSKETTNVSIPLGSLVLTGLIPAALENEIINIPVASLVLTGFAITVLEGENINVPVASLVMTGFAVIPGENVVEIIPLGTLVLTGFVPSVLESTIVNIPVASLVLTGFVPIVSLDTEIEVPTGSLVLTGFVPAVLENDIINIPLGTLILTGLVPAAVENTIVNVPVSSLALTGFAPVVLESTIVNVPVANLPLAGFVPSALENDIINIPLAIVTLTSFAVGFQVDVPVASLVLTGFAPTVVEGENINVPVGSLALTGFAVTHDITIPIPVASLNLTGLVPLAIKGTEVEVPVASLALTGFVPVVLEGTNVNIPVASLILTGFVVIPGENIVEEIPLGILTLTGLVSQALQNTIIEVPLSSLTLTGFIPVPVESTNDITVIVPFASLTLTGFSPAAVVGGDEVISIPKAVLTLISFSPNVVLTLFNIETCDMDIIFPKNVDKLIIPVLQSIEFNLERLKNIDLPDPVIVTDIGEFLALEPVAPAKEVERIVFLYADFALTVQNVIDGKIGELIAEVKPYDVEAIEWGRAKEDLLEDSEESIESSFDGEASRGFVAPSGVFNKDISKQSVKLKKNISRANEVFFSGQNTNTLQNMTDGLQAGNQAEVIVRKTDSERQTINLQAVQNLVEIDFRVFEVYLERHNSSIEIKRIKHQAWLEEIRAQLLILQEREIAIKGYTLNLTERAKQVEMFNIAIDYLNAKQALKEIDLENFILQSEVEKNKLLKFQAEVDKFSALINLNIAKFNLYKAGIDFEESKVDKFREEAAVADAQLGVQNAKTTASRIKADTKIDIANTKLQAQLEKLRAARSRLDTALSTGRARIVNFSGDLLVYQSELRDFITENADEILENISQKESQRDLDVTDLRNLSRFDVNTVKFNTESQNIADLANLNAEVIDKSADITAKTEITSKLIHSLVGG